MNQRLDSTTEQHNFHASNSFSRSRWQGTAFRLLLFAVAFTFCMSFVGRKHDAEYSKEFWDRLLGGAAWLTDREYDPNAKTLTDQLTLKKKNRP